MWTFKNKKLLEHDFTALFPAIDCDGGRKRLLFWGLARLQVNLNIPFKVKWHPSEKGWVKLNVDRSFLDNPGKDGARRLIRDQSGT